MHSNFLVLNDRDRRCFGLISPRIVVFAKCITGRFDKDHLHAREVAERFCYLLVAEIEKCKSIDEVSAKDASVRAVRSAIESGQANRKSASVVFASIIKPHDHVMGWIVLNIGNNNIFRIHNGAFECVVFPETIGNELISKGAKPEKAAIYWNLPRRAADLQTMPQDIICNRVAFSQNDWLVIVPGKGRFEIDDLEHEADPESIKEAVMRALSQYLSADCKISIGGINAGHDCCS